MIIGSKVYEYRIDSMQVQRNGKWVDLTPEEIEQIVKENANEMIRRVDAAIESRKGGNYANN